MTGSDPNQQEMRRRLDGESLAGLCAEAAAVRDRGHGAVISYSRKVFIPLTKLCRDVCAYCTFAQSPAQAGAAYLSPERVLAIARSGAATGCHEALFTLGDKPELRYPAARQALAALGYASTLDYLAAMCQLVLKETGLLPHINAGVMDQADIARLRSVSVSQGLMLESAAERLCQRGGPHFGSPDKQPAARLATIAAAGRAGVPFTSGILIGIGESRAERLDALFALEALQRQYGHIQEIIVQNFRAKPGTRMAGAAEPTLEELQWTVAAARLIFGPDMNIQCPPNLSPGAARALIAAGINDWGGISPVTIDHVNPEAPWPAVEELAAQTASAGKHLVARLAAYPSYCRQPQRWFAGAIATRVRRMSDAEGFARRDGWAPGMTGPLPTNFSGEAPGQGALDPAIAGTLAKVERGTALGQDDIVAMFAARGGDFAAVCAAADALRRETVGDTVTYAVNRNINYTNICHFRCQFCAFSKGKMAPQLRGRPYDLEMAEIVRRAQEAWERGATEVCLQGGIHPDYTGSKYLEICQAIHAALPDMHIHAFSPLEIHQGAASLGLGVREFLIRLRAAGLGTLPGTAAEILDDEVRAIICPDKIDTQTWLDVVGTAHEVGLRTTSTIMFGHVDRPEHWARHLLRLRALQERTGGISEFVPLPFVHMEAPIYLRGQARSGPTLREAVLMHAVARLALHPLIVNIQTSWVKMGPHGAQLCLRAGANDLGGTLMNESISRAAGTGHGQEMPPAEMERLIGAIGRVARQRGTLYGEVAAERQQAAKNAAPLLALDAAPMQQSAAAGG